MKITERLTEIRSRIESACNRVGRNPKAVKIVAVSKTVSAEKIRQAVDAGIEIIGENKVQEARQKFFSCMDLNVAWHFIGHLQTNKVKHALEFADVIESVDSYHLAEAIDRRAGMSDRENVDVFVQVNTSGEQSKFGIEPGEARALIRQINDLPHVTVTGLMTIGLFTADAEQTRPCFRLLKELLEKINQERICSNQLEHLSMGMTNDFQVAVEEGATLVRIGRALFGERQ
ncbi:YggS family pyridoxal phosphate-dependent enzyme [candidate division KSB1 bacterium]|nr:YggS family pyridoxal phosphate-dependent enzyme [candidate division KSB1 bacterium]